MSEAAEAGPAATTRDAFYGGRLIVRQPAKGHRSGTDAVLLAASVPTDFGGLCYDMGAGVGVAGLGVALLRPGSRLVLVEQDATLCAMAEANATEACLAGRAASVCCDILDPAARRRLLPEPADLVITNPPFHDAKTVRPSPEAGRRAAHVLREGATSADWLAACLDRLAPRGMLIAIHAAERLPDLVAALDGRGALAVKPILPRAGEAARRVLVRLVRGSRAPFVLAAPLVLHEGDRFTAECDALHRGEAASSW